MDKFIKCFISFIAKNTFLCAFFLLGCGTIVQCYFSESALLGVGQSIIASFFFYLMLEYFPMKNKEYQSVKADAVLYRHLQLLLVRLDEIFICPHKVLNTEYAKSSCVSVDVFYSKSVQLEVMSKFNIDREIPYVHRSFTSRKPIKYREFLYYNWNAITHYAHLILNNNRIYDNTDLYYELDYLINESMLAIMLNANGILPLMRCENICYLLYSDDASGNINNDLEKHIIKIHYLAFNMYEKLHEYDIDIIHKPMFYYNAYKNNYS